MSRRIIIIALSLILTLSACAGTKESLPASQPGSSIAEWTATPTFTPTPVPQVRYSNAEKLLLGGDYDAAFNEFQLGSTQSNDPELAAASLLGMGRALLLKRDYRGAVNQFSTLLINYPTGEARNTSFFFLAQAYDALDQPRLAADAYGSYLSALPGPLDG